MPLDETTPPTNVDRAAARARLRGETVPFFVARVRAGVGLVLVSILVFALADCWLAPHRLPQLVAVKLTQIAGAATLSWLLGRARAWRPAVGAVLVALTVHAFLIALGGVIRHDATIAPLLFIILAMGVGTLLPWGAGPQLAAVVAI